MKMPEMELGYTAENEKSAVTPNRRKQKSMLVKNAENLFLTVMVTFLNVESLEYENYCLEKDFTIFRQYACSPIVIHVVGNKSIYGHHR
jgi:hypothetical protein